MNLGTQVLTPNKKVGIVIFTYPNGTDAYEGTTLIRIISEDGGYDFQWCNENQLKVIEPV